MWKDADELAAEVREVISRLPPPIEREVVWDVGSGRWVTQGAARNERK